MGLMLSRRLDESIQIGDDVVIKIGRIGRRAVQLLVTAPETTRVMRLEAIDRPAKEGARRRRRDEFPTTLLVVKRREGESIRVGDDTTMTVDMIVANRVILSIDAPDEIVVLRTEIIDRPPSETQPQQKATA